MVAIRIIVLLLFFPSTLLADCNNNFSAEKAEIKNLEVEIFQYKKFISEIGKKLIRYNSIKGQSISSSDYIKKQKKRNANVIVTYTNGITCKYKAKIRAHGDLVDHIELIDGTPVSSMRVRLLEGNIKNITRFILLRPKTRMDANEIFLTTILNELGFLAPRSQKIDVTVNGLKSKYIFQESIKKEMLEKNLRVEGSIIESNEDFINPLLLQMGRISNKEWIKQDKNKLKTSINAINDYNILLLSSYPLKIKKNFDDMFLFNYDFFENSEIENINIFDALLFGLGGSHALSYDDRRFYYNSLYSRFEPIYYDGNSNILSIAGYDWRKDEFVKNLEKWKLIKPLVTNHDDNFNRPKNLIFFNPVPTKSAKKGAKEGLKLIQNIDKKLLLKKLHENGLKKIEAQHLDLVLKEVLKRLNQIMNSKTYDKNLVLQNSIYSKYYESMEFKGDLQLIFNEDLQQKKFDNQINFEVCNYKLNNCLIKPFKNNEIFDLLEQNTKKNEYKIYVGLTKKRYENGISDRSTNLLKNKLNYMKINENFNLSISKDINYSLDIENRILDLEFLDINSRAIIFKSELDTWTINTNYKGSKNFKSENIYGLTGCLTIVDSKLDKVNFNVNNSKCEDGINFIRSQGNVAKIIVKGAQSDGVDADFSNLEFDELIIEDSINDCLDVSFGNYSLKKAILNNCGDKAISVGEKSILKSNKTFIDNSKMGVASKDSSKAFFDKINLNNVNLCLSAYKKKQEFSGGYINIKHFECLNFKYDIDIDKYSNIILENRS
jgi:hypothetical protein